MYEHIVAICGQMIVEADFRSKYKIDPSAFGKFKGVVAYLLSCGGDGVLPAKVKEFYPDAFHDVLQEMGRSVWTNEQFQEAVRMVYADDFSTSKLPANQKFAKLAERTADLNATAGGEDPFESLSSIQDKFSQDGRVGDPTPFPELEKYIYGWERKRVYTIGAYSNVGKSKFVYSIMAHAVRQGKKCLFLSLEVESGIVLANLASSYLRKPYMDVLKDGNCHMSLPKELIQIVDDKYEFNELKDAVESVKPDYVFLDFVQNVRNGSGNEYESMSKTAVQLQELAKKANVALFVVSQVPNESRFKEGDNVTLKGSGSLFSSSDCILMLTRDGDKIIMTLAKNKVGPAMRKFEMSTDFNRGQVSIAREITMDFGPSGL